MTGRASSSGQPCYIGIDVGTGSARAILLDAAGETLSSYAQATKTFRTPADSRIFQQSTQDIWSAICLCVKKCLSEAQVDKSRVKGVGFDATCSLAVVDTEGKEIDVTPNGMTLAGAGGEVVPNIILWADHRAEEEASAINKTGHKVLEYVGGTMSLEMEIPKTLWLKKHLEPSLFSRCQFFDLPDYLTYKATASPARSTCSLVCKTSYLPPGVAGSTIGWSEDFLSTIGLGSLAETDYAQLGGIPGKNGLILTAGQPVGAGLTDQAAEELGLLPGTAVGSGLIDAYAGWVGTVAAPASNEPESQKVSVGGSKHRLAAIAGTSTCYCVQSEGEQGVFVEGVWGPYKDVVFPGFWQNEGGQSSTGQLIDFTIETHPATPQLKLQAEKEGTNLFSLLDEILVSLQKRLGVPTLIHLTKHLHLYPDLHGNRSPLADSSMKGLISGLTLSSGPEDLALKYLATLEAIALQTRQIVEKMNKSGHEIDSIFMSGSQAKNATLMQLLADGCNVKVLIPEGGGSTAVVKGAAILGRFASEVAEEVKSLTSQEQANELGWSKRDRLWQMMVEMTKEGYFLYPRATGSEKKLLDAKYQIFLESIDVQRRWKKLTEEAIVS
ncbi:Pentulose kinase [Microstroma glucosiphilum]|uniref:Pentulose kinase n=1 Tax=Pseudomicrostroma glucosiphilum TaxID=1684307 RepID=A0A316U1L4_9BASI|nr:Pentulose kinase [Pseudomicrostroma glucosiphilum]PWN19259.1 Pentulose kinase [Pseudomicrostroma glucosiphilum]